MKVSDVTLSRVWILSVEFPPESGHTPRQVTVTGAVPISEDDARYRIETAYREILEIEIAIVVDIHSSDRIPPAGS